MTTAIATGPLPTPPPQQLTCEGCGVACATDDVLRTSDGLVAVCPGCWNQPRSRKAVKNEILAALERAVATGDGPGDESP